MADGKQVFTLGSRNKDEDMLGGIVSAHHCSLGEKLSSGTRISPSLQHLGSSKVVKRFSLRASGTVLATPSSAHLLHPNLNRICSRRRTCSTTAVQYAQLSATGGPRFSHPVVYQLDIMRCEWQRPLEHSV